MNEAFDAPSVLWHGPDAADGPLVVLLHGRGADEKSIIGLAGQLPTGASYAAVRAPISSGGGYAWFANRGIGGRVPPRYPERPAHRHASALMGARMKELSRSEYTDLQEVAAAIDRLVEQQRARNVLALATLRPRRITGP